MMISPLYLLCAARFRRRVLLSGFQFSLYFHQYAPSKPRQKPSPGGDGDYPNLLSHKDWLSTPEVVRIFHNLKDPNFALPLLAQLSIRKDYNPNESLYATVINKLAVAKNFDGIEALMKTIKAERKCRLSDGFFRDVIRIYGHSAGRINKAIETLFDMPNYKCWPSVGTFNFVLNLLVSAKQFEVVHEVYMGASNLGVEIDACCLNIIIKGLCECGEIEGAQKVLEEFPQQKCTPTTRTFSTLMHALCDRNRVDDSFLLLNRMESEGIEADAVVFNILISGMRKQGRVEEGVKLFDTMMLKGCNPNAGTYQEVLYCFLDCKRFREAKLLMEEMTERGMNPSFESYKRVIEGFCGEREVEDVEWALKQMVVVGFVPKMGMWKRMVECILSGDNAVDSDSLLFAGIDEKFCCLGI